MSKVLVALAEGFETIEALAVVDVLRRGNVEVVTAAVGDRAQVNSSHNIPVVADAMLVDCVDDEWDLVVLPGGVEGSENLAASSHIAALLERQNSAGRRYAAICAAPAVVLEKHGLLAGRRATCHPGYIAKIPAASRQDDGVVVSANCTTARGAGWAILFGLELLEQLEGRESREAVETGLALR